MLRAFLSPLLLLALAPAAAQSYRAGLETPAAVDMIVKDVRWACAGVDCTAPRTAAAPDGNVCAAVVRKLGRVISFQAGGRAFEAAELEKCNSVAR